MHSYILLMPTIHFYGYMIIHHTPAGWYLLISLILVSGKIFHSNIDVPANKINFFSMYYKQIIKGWSENLSSFPNLMLAIMPQVIWYNKCIKVKNKNTYNLKCSQKI